MLPVATAHTFCASRDGSRKSGFLAAVPVETERFLRGLQLLGKSRSWQREIIKHQFGKKLSYIVLYISAF